MKVSDMQVELMDSYGDDLLVVDAARVSFAKASEWDYDYGMDGLTNLRLSEKDTKLVKYLARENHWMPFAHAHMTFRIKAPIFVARQLGKHQIGFSWSEESRRYIKSEPEFYFPDYWRAQAENVKQGSSDQAVPFIADPARVATAQCLSAYNMLLDAGVCAEQARLVLPQNTMTNWVWTGSLMAFARMCKLRLDAHTQRETQEIAQLVSKHAEFLYPVSWKALMEYGE
jgi:thymidylate synthase (FAD)